jgi:TRAP-type uncharacterized transport system fused permease subunit
MLVVPTEEIGNMWLLLMPFVSTMRDSPLGKQAELTRREGVFGTLTLLGWTAFFFWILFIAALFKFIS